MWQTRSILEGILHEESTAVASLFRFSIQIFAQLVHNAAAACYADWGDREMQINYPQGLSVTLSDILKDGQAMEIFLSG